MFSNGYTYRRSVTQDHTKVAGGASLADFPVLVTLTLPPAHVTSPSGYDVVFTADRAGGVRLDHDLESYDSTTGAFTAWVRLPALSASADTIFYVFYGNANIASSQANPTGVWGAAHRSVIHGGTGSTLGLADASGHMGTGLATGGVTATPGSTAGGINFDGTGSVNYGTGTATASLARAPWTVSFWLTQNGTGFNNILLGRNDGNSVNAGWWVEHITAQPGTNGGAPGLRLIAECSTINMKAGAASPTGRTLVHFVGDGSQTAANQKVYYNGVLQSLTTTVDGSGSAGADDAESLYLGYNRPSSAVGVTLSEFTGVLDEIRLVSVARSAGWVGTEYANQSAPTSFCSVGAEQTAGSGYLYRRAIAVDHTKVSGGVNLANFPVLVSFTDATLKSSANGGHVQSAAGYDLLFELSDGTQLDHEVESWSPTTGQLTAWVRVPTLSASTDTTLYLLYGNASVTSTEENPAGIWGTGYECVIHGGNGTVPSLADSSGTMATGTATGGVTATTGTIAGALSFDGTGSVDYGTGAATANLARAPWTISFWLTQNGSAFNNILLARNDGNTTNAGWWIENITASPGANGGAPGLRMVAEASSINMRAGAASPTGRTLVHIVGDGSQIGANQKIYYDGMLQVLNTTVDGSGTVGQDTAESLYLGYNRPASAVGITLGEFSGVLDEVRLASIARSAGWAATEYANQGSPGTFCIVGSEEATGSATGPAWQANGPLAQAIYANWPTQDDATLNAYLADSSRNPNHGSTFGQRSYDGSQMCSFDTTVLIAGKPSVRYTALRDHPQMAADQFGRFPSTNVDDMTVHVVRAFGAPKYGSTDPIPLISLRHYAPDSSSTLAGSNTGTYQYAVAQLQFDTALYGAGGFDSGAMDYRGGIFIVHQRLGGLAGMGYRLCAALTSPSGALLSTESRIDLFGIGDEMWDGLGYDWFIRTYRSGANKQTLNIEVYVGPHGSQPTKVGGTSITMNDTTKPFPQSVSYIHDRDNSMAQLGQDFYSCLGYVAVYDNTANPNLALNYATAPALAGARYGLGRRGQYGCKSIVPAYSSTASATADLAHLAISNQSYGAWVAGDAPHENAPGVFRITNPAGVDGASSHLAYDLPRPVSELWTRETFFFPVGWADMGAGLLAGTLLDPITVAGVPVTVRVQNVTGNMTSGSGTLGRGTANLERVAALNYSAGAGTIAVTCAKSHAAGEEIRVSAEPSFRMAQFNLSYASYDAVDTDGSLDLIGRTYRTSLTGSGSAFDVTRPSLHAHTGTHGEPAGAFLNGTDGASAVYDTASTIPSGMDVISTPTPVNQANNYSAPGARAGQAIPLRVYQHIRVWWDGDYGAYRVRLEQYWASASGAGYEFDVVEAISVAGITDPRVVTAITFGGPFSDSAISDQFVDQYSMEWIDPNDPTYGPDPYGIMSSFGEASYPSAPTAGVAAASSSTVTVSVSAPASAVPVVLQMIAERFNGVAWAPDTSQGSSGVVNWTAGPGGTQSYTFTGLSSGTDYSGRLRVRLVSPFGQGAPATVFNAVTTG